MIVRAFAPRQSLGGGSVAADQRGCAYGEITQRVTGFRAFSCFRDGRSDRHHRPAGGPGGVGRGSSQAVETRGWNVTRVGVGSYSGCAAATSGRAVGNRGWNVTKSACADCTRSRVRTAQPERSAPPPLRSGGRGPGGGGSQGMRGSPSDLHRILPSPHSSIVRGGAGGGASRGTRPGQSRRVQWIGARCRAQAGTWPRLDPSARAECAAGRLSAPGPQADRSRGFGTGAPSRSRISA